MTLDDRPRPPGVETGPLGVCQFCGKPVERGTAYTTYYSKPAHLGCYLHHFGRKCHNPNLPFELLGGP